jgi:lysozyme
MADMVLSPFGLAMIKAFEGFYPKRYRCPAGVWTQGYGHTEMSGGEPLGGTWTEAKASAVLREALARKYEPGVRKLLKREPTQGQYDALVSFAYNCGVGALAKSSILKFFNRGKDAQSAAAFGLWVKAKTKKGSVTLPGLVRRRASEALAYQGLKDENFDGHHTSSEPIYGRMPQAVQQETEDIGTSGTGAGTGVAAAGGAAVVVKSAQDVLTQAEPHLSSGKWIGLALGVVILAGAAYAGYRKWVDMGRPVPWRG